MVKCDCIRFIYILFLPDKFFLWLPNRLFKIYNKATSSETVYNEFCFLLRWEGRGSKTVVNIFANFLSLLFSKTFTRQRIALVKTNAAECKLKGRTMNIKQLILPSIFQEKPKYLIIIVNVNVMVTLTYVEFVKKILSSSPVIKLYSDLISKKNRVSQIQDKFFLRLFLATVKGFTMQKGFQFP